MLVQRLKINQYNSTLELNKVIGSYQWMQKKVFAKFNALLDWQRTKESNPGILNEKNKWDNVRSGINKVEKRRKKNASMTNC